jgi:hypothetical protein
MTRPVRAADPPYRRGAWRPPYVPQVGHIFRVTLLVREPGSRESGSPRRRLWGGRGQARLNEARPAWMLPLGARSKKRHRRAINPKIRPAGPRRHSLRPGLACANPRQTAATDDDVRGQGKCAPRL